MSLSLKKTIKNIQQGISNNEVTQPILHLPAGKESFIII